MNKRIQKKKAKQAEEAVQAAYVSAFSSIDRFEGRSSLSTWLTRIVINEALGRVRAQRRRRASLDAEGVPVLDSYREKLMAGSQPPPPDSAVASEQLRRLLERAIAGLPETFRTVFVLREIEGLSAEAEEARTRVVTFMGRLEGIARRQAERRAAKESFRTQVLVNVRPMDAEPRPREMPVLALSRRRGQETGIPGQRHRDPAAILQIHDQGVFGEADAFHAFICPGL